MNQKNTDKIKGKKSDGVFYMEYDDWNDCFSQLFVNMDFPEQWTGVRFESKWTKGNSMGIPRSLTQHDCETYAKNP